MFHVCTIGQKGNSVNEIVNKIYKYYSINLKIHVLGRRETVLNTNCNLFSFYNFLTSLYCLTISTCHISFITSCKLLLIDSNTFLILVMKRYYIFSSTVIYILHKALWCRSVTFLDDPGILSRFIERLCRILTGVLSLELSKHIEQRERETFQSIKRQIVAESADDHFQATNLHSINHPSVSNVSYMTIHVL